MEQKILSKNKKSISILLQDIRKILPLLKPKKMKTLLLKLQYIEKKLQLLTLCESKKIKKVLLNILLEIKSRFSKEPLVPNEPLVPIGSLAKDSSNPFGSFAPSPSVDNKAKLRQSVYYGGYKQDHWDGEKAAYYEMCLLKWEEAYGFKAKKEINLDLIAECIMYFTYYLYWHRFQVATFQSILMKTFISFPTKGSSSAANYSVNQLYSRMFYNQHNVSASDGQQINLFQGLDETTLNNGDFVVLRHDVHIYDNDYGKRNRYLKFSAAKPIRVMDGLVNIWNTRLFQILIDTTHGNFFQLREAHTGKFLGMSDNTINSLEIEYEAKDFFVMNDSSNFERTLWTVRTNRALYEDPLPFEHPAPYSSPNRAIGAYLWNLHDRSIIRLNYGTGWEKSGRVVDIVGSTEDGDTPIAHGTEVLEAHLGKSASIFIQKVSGWDLNKMYPFIQSNNHIYEPVLSRRGKDKFLIDKSQLINLRPGIRNTQYQIKILNFNPVTTKWDYASDIWKLATIKFEETKIKQGWMHEVETEIPANNVYGVHDNIVVTHYVGETRYRLQETPWDLTNRSIIEFKTNRTLRPNVCGKGKILVRYDNPPLDKCFTCPSGHRYANDQSVSTADILQYADGSQPLAYDGYSDKSMFEINHITNPIYIYKKLRYLYSKGTVYEIWKYIDIPKEKNIVRYGKVSLGQVGAYWEANIELISFDGTIMNQTLFQHDSSGATVDDVQLISPDIKHHTNYKNTNQCLKKTVKCAPHTVLTQTVEQIKTKTDEFPTCEPCPYLTKRPNTINAKDILSDDDNTCTSLSETCNKGTIMYYNPSVRELHCEPCFDTHYQSKSISKNNTKIILVLEYIYNAGDGSPNISKYINISPEKKIVKVGNLLVDWVSYPSPNKKKWEANVKLESYDGTITNQNIFQHDAAGANVLRVLPFEEKDLKKFKITQNTRTDYEEELDNAKLRGIDERRVEIPSNKCIYQENIECDVDTYLNGETKKEKYTCSPCNVYESLPFQTGFMRRRDIEIYIELEYTYDSGVGTQRLVQTVSISPHHKIKIMHGTMDNEKYKVPFLPKRTLVKDITKSSGYDVYHEAYVELESLDGEIIKQTLFRHGTSGARVHSVALTTKEIIEEDGYIYNKKGWEGNKKEPSGRKECTEYNNMTCKPGTILARNNNGELKCNSCDTLTEYNKYTKGYSDKNFSPNLMEIKYDPSQSPENAEFIFTSPQYNSPQYNTCTKQPDIICQYEMMNTTNTKRHSCITVENEYSPYITLYKNKKKQISKSGELYWPNMPKIDETKIKKGTKIKIGYELEYKRADHTQMIIPGGYRIGSTIYKINDNIKVNCNNISEEINYLYNTGVAGKTSSWKKIPIPLDKQIVNVGTPSYSWSSNYWEANVELIRDDGTIINQNIFQHGSSGAKIKEVKLNREYTELQYLYNAGDGSPDIWKYINISPEKKIVNVGTPSHSWSSNYWEANVELISYNGTIINQNLFKHGALGAEVERVKLNHDISEYTELKYLYMKGTSYEGWRIAQIPLEKKIVSIGQWNRKAKKIGAKWGVNVELISSDGKTEPFTLFRHEGATVDQVILNNSGVMYAYYKTNETKFSTIPNRIEYSYNIPDPENPIGSTEHFGTVDIPNNDAIKLGMDTSKIIKWGKLQNTLDNPLVKVVFMLNYKEGEELKTKKLESDDIIQNTTEIHIDDNSLSKVHKCKTKYLTYTYWPNIIDKKIKIYKEFVYEYTTTSGINYPAAKRLDKNDQVISYAGDFIEKNKKYYVILNRYNGTSFARELSTQTGATIRLLRLQTESYVKEKIYKRLIYLYDKGASYGGWRIKHIPDTLKIVSMKVLENNIEWKQNSTTSLWAANVKLINYNGATINYKLFEGHSNSKKVEQVKLIQEGESIDVTNYVNTDGSISVTNYVNTDIIPDETTAVATITIADDTAEEKKAEEDADIAAQQRYHDRGTGMIGLRPTAAVTTTAAAAAAAKKVAEEVAGATHKTYQGSYGKPIGSRGRWGGGLNESLTWEQYIMGKTKKVSIHMGSVYVGDVSVNLDGTANVKLIGSDKVTEYEQTLFLPDGILSGVSVGSILSENINNCKFSYGAQGKGHSGIVSKPYFISNKTTEFTYEEYIDAYNKKRILSDANNKIPLQVKEGVYITDLFAYPQEGMTAEPGKRIEFNTNKKNVVTAIPIGYYNPYYKKYTPYIEKFITGYENKNYKLLAGSNSSNNKQIKEPFDSKQGYLNSTTAWTPTKQQEGEWWEIDLGRNCVIIGIGTQGHKADGGAKQAVKQVKIGIGQTKDNDGGLKINYVYNKNGFIYEYENNNFIRTCTLKYSHKKHPELLATTYSFTTHVEDSDSTNSDIIFVNKFQATIGRYVRIFVEKWIGKISMRSVVLVQDEKFEISPPDAGNDWKEVSRKDFITKYNIAFKKTTKKPQKGEYIIKKEDVVADNRIMPCKTMEYQNNINQTSCKKKIIKCPPHEYLKINNSLEKDNECISGFDLEKNSDDDKKLNRNYDYEAWGGYPPHLKRYQPDDKEKNNRESQWWHYNRIPPTDIGYFDFYLNKNSNSYEELIEKQREPVIIHASPTNEKPNPIKYRLTTNQICPKHLDKNNSNITDLSEFSIKQKDQDIEISRIDPVIHPNTVNEDINDNPRKLDFNLEFYCKDGPIKDFETIHKRKLKCNKGEKLLIVDNNNIKTSAKIPTKTSEWTSHDTEWKKSGFLKDNSCEPCDNGKFMDVPEHDYEICLDKTKCGNDNVMYEASIDKINDNQCKPCDYYKFRRKDDADECKTIANINSIIVSLAYIICFYNLRITYFYLKDEFNINEINIFENSEINDSGIKRELLINALKERKIYKKLEYVYSKGKSYERVRKVSIPQEKKIVSIGKVPDPHAAENDVGKYVVNVELISYDGKTNYTQNLFTHDSIGATAHDVKLTEPDNTFEEKKYKWILLKLFMIQKIWNLNLDELSFTEEHKTALNKTSMNEFIGSRHGLLKRGHLERIYDYLYNRPFFSSSSIKYTTDIPIGSLIGLYNPHKKTFLSINDANEVVQIKSLNGSMSLNGSIIQQNLIFEVLNGGTGTISDDNKKVKTIGLRNFKKKKLLKINKDDGNVIAGDLTDLTTNSLKAITNQFIENSTSERFVIEDVTDRYGLIRLKVNYNDNKSIKKSIKYLGVNSDEGYEGYDNDNETELINFKIVIYKFKESDDIIKSINTDTGSINIEKDIYTHNKYIDYDNYNIFYKKIFILENYVKHIFINILCYYVIYYLEGCNNDDLIKFILLSNDNATYKRVIKQNIKTLKLIKKIFNFDNDCYTIVDNNLQEKIDYIYQKCNADQYDDAEGDKDNYYEDINSHLNIEGYEDFSEKHRLYKSLNSINGIININPKVDQKLFIPKSSNSASLPDKIPEILDDHKRFCTKKNERYIKCNKITKSQKDQLINYIKTSYKVDNKNDYYEFLKTINDLVDTTKIDNKNNMDKQKKEVNKLYNLLNKGCRSPISHLTEHNISEYELEYLYNPGVAGYESSREKIQITHPSDSPQIISVENPCTKGLLKTCNVKLHLSDGSVLDQEIFAHGSSGAKVEEVKLNNIYGNIIYNTLDKDKIKPEYTDIKIYKELKYLYNAGVGKPPSWKKIPIPLDKQIVDVGDVSYNNDRREANVKLISSNGKTNYIQNLFTHDSSGATVDQVKLTKEDYIKDPSGNIVNDILHIEDDKINTKEKCYDFILNNKIGTDLCCNKETCIPTCDDSFDKGKKKTVTRVEDDENSYSIDKKYKELKEDIDYKIDKNTQIISDKNKLIELGCYTDLSKFEDYLSFIPINIYEKEGNPPPPDLDNIEFYGRTSAELDASKKPRAARIKQFVKDIENKMDNAHIDYGKTPNKKENIDTCLPRIGKEYSSYTGIREKDITLINTGLNKTEQKKIKEKQNKIKESYHYDIIKTDINLDTLNPVSLKDYSKNIQNNLTEIKNVQKDQKNKLNQLDSIGCYNDTQYREFLVRKYYDTLGCDTPLGVNNCITNTYNEEHNKDKHDSKRADNKKYIKAYKLCRGENYNKTTNQKNNIVNHVHFRKKYMNSINDDGDKDRKLKVLKILYLKLKNNNGVEDDKKYYKLFFKKNKNNMTIPENMKFMVKVFIDLINLSEIKYWGNLFKIYYEENKKEYPSKVDDASRIMFLKIIYSILTNEINILEFFHVCSFMIKIDISMFGDKYIKAYNNIKHDIKYDTDIWKTMRKKQMTEFYKKAEQIKENNGNETVLQDNIDDKYFISEGDK
jgi:hypothetical protein